MTASHSLSAVRPANNMPLTTISKGKLEKPARVLLYGVEKIGKSTFAAGAPDPIFICSEDGTSELDVARFREPRYWEEARYAIDTLCREKHEHRTLVIDTLDWLEPLCWREVCRKGSVQSIEDFGGGYGKGYLAALDEWRQFLADLDDLRAKRGMGVVLLAHSWIKSFKNPEGDDFDRAHQGMVRCRAVRHLRNLHQEGQGRQQGQGDFVRSARRSYTANRGVGRWESIRPPRDIASRLGRVRREHEGSQARGASEAEGANRADARRGEG
jgi:hypothetical protein